MPRPRTHARFLPCLAVVWAAFGLAGSAAQANVPESTGKVTISASPLYGYVVLDRGEEPSGGGATMSLGYALTDAVSLQLSGIWTVHQVAPTEDRAGGSLHMVSVLAVGAYALDLLSFTPMIEIGAGVLHRRLADASATDLALMVGLSAHYWIVDWLGLGARLHYHAFLTDLRNFPIFVDLGPSLAVRW